MLTVTPDGHVSTDGRRFYSLEKIQAAVEMAQHPTLTANQRMPDVTVIRYQSADGKELNMHPTTNCNCKEEALPLPTTLVRNEQTANYDDGSEEHLPLPSSRVRKQAAPKGQPKQTMNEGEHLPLPSTFRKTK